MQRAKNGYNGDVSWQGRPCYHMWSWSDEGEESLTSEILGQKKIKPHLARAESEKLCNREPRETSSRYVAFERVVDMLKDWTLYEREGGW